MSGAPWAWLRRLPGRLVDAVLRWQIGAAGLVEVHGHHVYAPGLAPEASMIDAGAHTGAFSRAILERFGCRCHALEPVPQLFARIAEGPRLRRFLLALGDRDGSATLHLSANPESNSLDPARAASGEPHGSLTTRVATLRSFLREAGLERADLLKLDVEGAEIGILSGGDDELLAGLGQIAVEFHDFLGAAADPGTAAAIAAIRQRLSRLGFRSLVLSRPASNHSDTLFVNDRRHRLTPWQRLNWTLLRHGTLGLRRWLHQAGSHLATIEGR